MVTDDTPDGRDPTGLEQVWAGFLDDGSLVPEVPAGTDAPTLAPHPSPMVGDRLVADHDVPELVAAAYPGPVRLGLMGGAGQVRGPARRCVRAGLALRTLVVTLRDPEDFAANARRVVLAVDEARDEGSLPEEVAVHVAVPGPATPSWLGAADELAAAGMALTLPLGDPDLAGRITAALDREMCFSLTGGVVGDAVDAVRTTARVWDGDAGELARARRWCRSWTTRDVDAAIAHLQEQGDGG